MRNFLKYPSCKHVLKPYYLVKRDNERGATIFLQGVLILPSILVYQL